MNDDAIHQWLIECFGPIQGEEAWKQLDQLPFELREQLLNQNPDKLPKPDEVRGMMQAFSAGGLNNPYEMEATLEEGPINRKLAQSIALQHANGDQGNVNADVADATRRALSQANLWLDITCNFNPAPGTPEVLSRADWVEKTLEAWVKFANPVAKSVNEALTSVIEERFRDVDDAEVKGLFAGVVPIPLPEGMNNPAQLMKLLGNTSFAMQLGQAAGALSHEVHGSFDQGLALLQNPAGGLIPYNCIEYAKVWELDITEVMNYLALREAAHARLFASVPWLMPRFEALIIKYANGISIDLEAMEEQLRDVETMNPEAISGAVNLQNIGSNDSEEQRQALHSLETLLALVEGWVDCVTWQSGMAHIVHIEQLREMMRRERAAGGPAEVTFESLLGLHLRPRRMREASQLWEKLTRERGIEERDSLWSHPDLLPTLPEASEVTKDASNEGKAGNAGDEVTKEIDAEDATKTAAKNAIETQSNQTNEATEKTSESHESADSYESNKNTDNAIENAPIEKSFEKLTEDDLGTNDWDAELSKLLEEDARQKKQNSETGNETDDESGNEAGNESGNSDETDADGE
ncbi:hydrolase [Gardnerella sp. DNF01162]|uniref:zinc-dependent metalloprotease n=1 Tax=Gardnerella TaxID=2701 RepID=UPI000C9A7937|nr:zinc-dependent metalloprotease [Gardnerella sp. DNF01162]MDK6295350.1 zinc-dependent metalloprotease [Gardnerella swidsinskii]PMC44708.1 hydrolase [Gardnerella vaginalis]RFT33997.1 hydrolase [Bifidobacteriaceae bacterium NR020]RIY28536.1 hydrolase [Bifidobacteriaceae bacterium NR016]PNP90832.1 hydrolase [Gardnerella sp. DNF01162]